MNLVLKLKMNIKNKLKDPDSKGSEPEIQNLKTHSIGGQLPRKFSTSKEGQRKDQEDYNMLLLDSEIILSYFDHV